MDHWCRGDRSGPDRSSNIASVLQWSRAGGTCARRQRRHTPQGQKSRQGLPSVQTESPLTLYFNHSRIHPLCCNCSQMNCCQLFAQRLGCHGHREPYSGRKRGKQGEACHFKNSPAEQGRPTPGRLEIYPTRTSSINSHRAQLQDGRCHGRVQVVLDSTEGSPSGTKRGHEDQKNTA